VWCFALGGLGCFRVTVDRWGVIPDVSDASWASDVGRGQPRSGEAVGCSIDRSYELKPALLVPGEVIGRYCSSASVPSNGSTPAPSSQHIGAFRTSPGGNVPHA